MDDKCKLPPEVEEGNIEYKRKLCSLSRYRFQQLQSQMKWRVDEGKGTAIYLIGVDDDGTIVKLKKKDKKESLKNIKKLVAQIDSYIDSTTFKNGYFEIVIKKNVKLIDFVEKRIVFLGNTNVGKSTLISVLCGNSFDNGDGSARLNLFNHKHEMFTGITSSISIQTFDSHNKKIALIDLPGKNKYNKTKYYGLLSYDPELAVIVIDQTSTKKSINEIYTFVKFLKLPILFVKTKTDLDVPYKKINLNEVNDAIEVSCLNGKNIQFLKDKLSSDNNNNTKEEGNVALLKEGEKGDLEKDLNGNILNLSQILLEDDCIFQICDVYFLPDLGLIVSGILLSGELDTDTKMKLGPIKLDNKMVYHNISVTSIHCHQTPYNKLFQDHIGTVVIKFKDSKVNIKDIYNKISKSTYLCNYELNLYENINCHVKLLLSNANLKKGQHIQIYIRNIITECEIISLQNIDKSSVYNFKCEIKLLKKSYIRQFDKFIFDNGLTKGYGIIVH